jgi:hypothetical protein
MQPSGHKPRSISRSISGWVGVGLISSTLLIISPAAAANTLSSWQFDPATRQFTVTLPQGVAPRFLVAAEPARIILEIPNTRLGQVEVERSYGGAVQRVRLAELDGDILQVVLELAPGTALHPNHAQLTSMGVADQTRWVLTPLVAEAGTVATVPTSGPGQTHAANLPELPQVGLNPGADLAGTLANDDASAVADVASSLPLASVNGENNLTSPPEVPLPHTSSEGKDTPAAPEMVVELPVIPAADPGLAFPDEGQGRLSTTAANLMLPSDVDGLENLPETLPIDPFNIGMSEAEQVTVPGLDELDAVVGSVATVPTTPASAPEASTAITQAPPSSVASPSPEMANSVTDDGQEIAVTPSETVEAISSSEPDATTLSDSGEAEVLPETPEAVASTTAPSLAAESVSEAAPPITVAPPNNPDVNGGNTSSESATVASDSAASGEQPGGGAIAAPETVAETAQDASAPSDPDLVIAPEPPALDDSVAELSAGADAVELTVVPPADPLPSSASGPGNATSVQPETPTATLEAPAVATEPLPIPEAESVAITSPPPARGVDRSEAARIDVVPAQDLLIVPELPSTETVGSVVPPNNSAPGDLMVAASSPINFGQPLPGAAVKAVNSPSEMAPDAPANQNIPPDILIAAGTVLQLRYPGNEPLVLEPGTNLNEVLLLENDILDPITQGVLAPRGSQLIGQFQPNGTNQHWVSEMIIVPAGQRVPLASTSETLIGSPQVNGGRLAAGGGAGALALALLTGFSGIGLIGGAIVGATTMVGTSPQQVVIEPNQVIAVQVTENVPRAMPIASGPDLSREWGAE